MNSDKGETVAGQSPHKPSISAPEAAQRSESIEFQTENLLDWLDAAPPEMLDRIAFGVVGMESDGAVRRYNLFESRLSGLPPERVIGRHFFTEVAPCMNNFMVSHRFETETELDAVVDYMFTFRLAPMNVRLRLLRRPDAHLMFLAVEKRK